MRARLRSPALLAIAMLSASCAVWRPGEPDPPDASPSPAVEPVAPPSAAPEGEPAAAAAAEPARPVIRQLPADSYEQSLQQVRQQLAAGMDGVPTGADAGYYVDVLQARLQQSVGNSVAMLRDGDRILLSLPAGTSFEVGEANPSPAIREVLAPIGRVLAEFGMTLVAVRGHTDDSGPPSVNRALSGARALAVARLLADAGVAPGRLVAVGFGPSRPLASNTTESGREQNRRVELEVLLVAAG